MPWDDPRLALVAAAVALVAVPAAGWGRSWLIRLLRKISLFITWIVFLILSAQAINGMGGLALFVMANALFWAVVISLLTMLCARLTEYLSCKS